MADKKIARNMGVNLSLDFNDAKSALRDFSNEVKTNVNEAKAMETQFRSTGDELNATKAKMDGYTNALDAQRAKNDAIRTAMSQLNQETEAGRASYEKYSSELQKGETYAARLQITTEKATQAYKYQESGLAELTSELKHNSDMTDARVRALQAEGKEDEAAKAKLEGLKTATENLTKQYEIQKNELNQLSESGDKSSDAYKRQQLRVEQMGAKLAESKHDIKSFNETKIKPEVKGSTSVKDKLKSIDDSLEGTRSHFKEFLGANLLASGINNAFSSIKNQITGVFQAGTEYNKQIEGMKLGLDNFTNGNKEVSDQLSDIITKAHESNGYSIGTMSALAKKSYGIMGKNIDKTKELTEAFGEVGRATGKTDDDMTALAGTFTKISAGGDVSAKAFKQLEMKLPGFSEAVAKHMGTTKDKLADLAKSGKISMEDLGDGIEQIASVKGKRGLDNYEKSFEGFTTHFSDRYKSLSGKITESFFSANNSALGGLSKVLDGPEVDKAFTKIGDSASKAMSSITKSFSGVFGGSKTNPVADLANGVANSIEKLGNFVAKHAGDIKAFFTMVKDLGGAAFDGLKTTIKLVLPMLEEVGKFAKEHPTTFKILAGAVIGFDLALKGTLGTISLFTKTKKAFDGLKTGIEGIGKAGKVAGKGLAAAFNFAKSNPLLLIAGAITAVIVGLVELYKHNKKFKAFVDGMAKVAGDFFKGIGKWISQAWNTTKKIFGQVVKFFKKDWKELLLLIVNPFAGAFALLYKHNDKFRKSVNDLIKNVINIVKDLGKNISNIFGNISNFIGDTLNKIWKNISNTFKSIHDFISNIINDVRKILKNVFNSIVSFIVDTLNSIFKTWTNIWNNISNVFSNTWKAMKSFGSDSINYLHNTFTDVLGKIGKVFSDAWDGIKNGFNDMWDGMKKLASDGINTVIKPINMGIDGIDGIIHDFGGPKQAIGNIHDVHFATGTGAFSGERKPITKPTLALLNDGYDSPETGNKEALIHPNGDMEVVEGQNTRRWLAPGTEVLNAKELQAIMGARPFASGTGFLGSIWDGLKSAGNWVGKTAGNAWDGVKDEAGKFAKMVSYIGDAVAHPAQTLEKQFNPKTNGFGTLFDSFGGGVYDKAKGQVKDWWSELWGMAKGSVEGGSSSELLNNAEKFGNGKPYVWGAAGADSFDCSGLVEYALSQMGKSFPKYSGDQYNASTPVSNPEVGDLVFFGPGGGDHVGIYAGGGKMYSAMSPGSNPNIGMANISDWSEALSAQPYRRVPGLSASSDDVKASNPLQGLIKGQVGGMFDWIKKVLGPLMGGGTGTNGNVNSWSDDVKRALSQLGLSTSDSMIQRVLRQIQTESGGNASAIGGNDGLADGNATGLMQVKPLTFAANMLPGHGNIMNGYDNILAGLNYAKHRYGSDLGFLGQGHGYANGGLITKHQIAQIGEGNKPEFVIPLDGLKSSRGYELLGKTMTAMALRDGIDKQQVSDSSSINNLENKFDKMIDLLSKLVVGQNQPTPAYVVANQAKTEIDKVQAMRNSLDLLARG